MEKSKFGHECLRQSDTIVNIISYPGPIKGCIPYTRGRCITQHFYGIIHYNGIFLENLKLSEKPECSYGKSVRYLNTKEKVLVMRNYIIDFNINTCNNR